VLAPRTLIAATAMSAALLLLAGNKASRAERIAAARLPDDSLSSAAWLSRLPDGEEKRRFILDCTGCHQFDAVTASSAGRLKTESEWEAAITRMLGYAGATTGFPVISSYRDAKRTAAWLAARVARPTAEPARPNIAAADLREYALPVPQDLPHDVAVDARGKVVITGMFTHRMYELDPESGALGEMEIPVPRANPRAVEIAPNGDWWVVLGGPKQLARYTPSNKSWRTFDVGVYPHSLAIDGTGRAWFNGHFTKSPELIGWVDSSGVHSVTLQPHPTLAADAGGPIPYEIRIAPDGQVWTSELQGNRLVAYAPRTGAQRVFEMPLSHSGPRRFDIDARGIVWIPAYAANALVRLDPTTGDMHSYELPVRDAVPYVVRVHPRTGHVWLATAASDDLFDFDAATSRFVTYRLARGALVRHLAFDPRTNDVWLAYGESPGMAARVARLRPR
jgi:virginiamycin B lyase